MNTRQIRKEGNYAAVGLLFALLATGLWAVVSPIVRDAIYAASPYRPMEQITGARVGRTVFWTVTMEKSAPCDPTGGPTPYFRWEWGDKFVSTTVPEINGRAFVPRRVADVGERVKVGVISSIMPDDLPDGVASTVSLIVVCNRGDGKFRPYRITPDILVPADDGPLAFAPMT